MYKPMNNIRNEGKSLTLINSKSENNSQRKLVTNSEITKTNQDLLFFKNSILYDIRKIEERFNFKLTKQIIINSEQYDSINKKLSELSERISRINSLILDNNELNQKIKTFLRFQNKAEDNFNKINTKITNIQKEIWDYINNSERMINENLAYPGIIGINAKFLNFRYFIDYTIKNFKDLNEFRDEIRNYNINELRKKINKNISDFRTSISDNYKNSSNLINNSIKEFDKKVEDLIIKNYKNMEENETKFEELKNNINKFFSEYQTKFENLENNINNKYKEQLKEIDNLKNMKNELLTEVDDVKSYLEKIKSMNSNNITDNSTIKRNNNGRNQKNVQSDDNNNFYYQALSTSNKKYIIMNELINNNNNNILDNYQKNEIQHNTDFSLNNNDNRIFLSRKNSFEKITPNHYFKIRNKHKDLSFSHHKIRKKEDNKEFVTYLNKTNKDFRRNNYSISNIAITKIKQVILPENISKREINRESLNSLLSEQKRSILISNDLFPNIHQKNAYLNNMRKNILNMPKVNKQKIRINKDKNIKFSHSARTINRKIEMKNLEN